VESTVFEVTSLCSGTFSPGASVTGLPMPELAGMGATPKACSCSLAGVSGKAPGVVCFVSSSLVAAAATADGDISLYSYSCAANIRTIKRLDVFGQQDIVDVEVTIIFLGRRGIDNPVVIHHELVVVFLIGRR
jgi:hypothetical protein